MAGVRKAWIFGSAHRRKTPALSHELADLRRAFRTLFDPYRPERHYMRGPGPKWHAKYDRPPALAEDRAVPALARMSG